MLALVLNLGSSLGHRWPSPWSSQGQNLWKVIARLSDWISNTSSYGQTVMVGVCASCGSPVYLSFTENSIIGT